MQNTQYFWRLWRATGITIVVAALFHLTVAGLSFISTHQISYINPVSFLGLGTLLPAYTTSFTATLVSWIALISFGLCVFMAREWLGPFLTRDTTLRSVQKTDEQ